MDAFQAELLDRLPLGQAVLLLFSHVLSEPFLDGVYDARRGRCYEGRLTFPTMVYLIRDALVVHDGSGRASFRKAKDEGRLPTGLRAVYAKLGRMPLAVSAALLREATARLRGVLPDAPRPAAPPGSLARFVGLTLDGKTVKHVARRLKCLRDRRGRVNSGKLLAALDWGTGLAVALEPTPNSEANDVSLVAGLLAQLGPAAAGDVRLFIADRQFCDLPRLLAFAAGGHHFLVRHNRNIDFHPDPARPPAEGADRDGRRFAEEWGWLGAETHPLRRYVRRVTLCRPGEEDVAVVTDLLDAAAFPAADLLDAYLGRWDIERVFQQATDVFDLRHLIGGRPNATLFQAAFCLLLYNLTQVVRQYVARAGGKAAADVSTENLFADCTAELVTWATVGNPAAAAEAFPTPTDARQVRARLRALLGGAWHDRWLKAPAQKTHGKTRTTVYPAKGYTNVWKVLQEHQQPVKKPEHRAKQQT
jgi:hypothetical protein